MEILLEELYVGLKDNSMKRQMVYLITPLMENLK